MKAINQLRKRKGVSPVIATVILVAVAITVSVAVAYWMSGIAGQYTSFEKVEIQQATSTYDDTTNYEWTIVIKLKNTGTAAATLTSLFINDYEVDQYGWTIATLANEGEAATDMTTTTTIESGATVTLTLLIDGPGDTGETIPPVPGTDQWKFVSAGTTVNIKIHSAGGMDYIKLVQLT